ncbi:hypothetical protein DFR58_10310 [Anaerobacterium chartisolvens]|uniref:Uncharacterized protein n=1 Tax=Anaerobacterium chartisolvens TaxID=1297424 RepID=A0A369BFD3_9FIRM|nr:hypothetical protein [Anaerobacterium chartisolvens]RCX19266.1 hypothetical protein DFR58_10310 [Anaerobacterium chartisolvens]
MENSDLKDKLEVILKTDAATVSRTDVSLRDILEAIIKHRWIIFAVTVMCVLTVAIVGTLFSPHTGQVTAMIEFNFDGIEKGLDPYGKSFDVSKIKAPVVIDMVVKSLELDKRGISADLIRTNIRIEPVIPGGITEKIKQLEEAKKQNIEGLQNFTYYPSVYLISLDIPKDSGVDKLGAIEIMNEIIKQYREYFYLNYSDRNVLSNALVSIDYDEYDYPEITDIIHGQLDIITSYVSAKQRESEAGDFRSKQTGLAFSDIVKSIDVIKRVDLSKVESVINEYNLTKNRDRLIGLYQYKVRMAELENVKKEDESRVLNDALNKYERQKNIIMMPNMAGEQAQTAGGIEIGSSDKYYSELAGKAADAGVNARNSFHSAEYYKQRIDRLVNGNVSPELKQAGEKYIVSLLPGLKDKVESWIKLTNDTVSEYYEMQLYSTAMSSISPAEYKGIVNKMSLPVAAALGVGLILGLLIAFLREYWARSAAKTTGGA